ncbi:MAG: hypothetical protein JWR37_5170 [Mycobacterium sp.]|nr:hypothetical protein [Mycobacterium sp.]
MQVRPVERRHPRPPRWAIALIPPVQSASLEENDRREDTAVISAVSESFSLVRMLRTSFFDGALGNPQSAADAGVGTALGHLRQHLVLARAE